MDDRELAEVYEVMRRERIMNRLAWAVILLVVFGPVAIAVVGLVLSLL